MPTDSIAQRIEHSVAAYFEACGKRDAKAISDCFVADAVHYLPHIPPLRGGVAIGNAIVSDLQNRGGAYFIDKIISNAHHYTAGVEWSRTLAQESRILRGFEFCEFEPSSMLIREIRGYYASAPHFETARHELLGFDYAARGYRNAS